MSRETYETYSAEPEKIDLIAFLAEYFQAFRKFFLGVLILVILMGGGSFLTAKLRYQPMYEAYTSFVVGSNRAVGYSYYDNVTAMDKRMLELKVGIAYEADIRTAKAVLERVYREHPMVKKDEDIKVFVDSLGDSSVVLGIRGWVETSDYWQTRWDILERIKLSFDEVGIEIPYNKMDVHLKQ